MSAPRGDTARKHAAWLRECARRAEALAAEYRANADRIEARADLTRPCLHCGAWSGPGDTHRCEVTS